MIVFRLVRIQFQATQILYWHIIAADKL